MNLVRIACKFCWILVLLIIYFPTNVFASLTKEQSKDVANFAIAFIERGNERRDEKGYPLLVYALSNNWNTCIEIRRSGYNGELYTINKNNYHMKNGKYLNLGQKWCMDCGGFISYVYKTTLGLNMYLDDVEDPWHIKDMYADSNKYGKSEFFEFVYKNTPISKIDESKLEFGDVVIRMGSKENHGLIYVGDGMKTAHASRNAIKYSKDPVILGFEVVQLDKFYKGSTIVSIVRVKDGVVDPSQKVNSTIVWPDTGEIETLLNHENINIQFKSIKVYEDIEIYPKKILKTTKTTLFNNYVYNSERNLFEANRNKFILEKFKDTKYIEKQIVDGIINEIRRFILLHICMG